MHNGRFLSQLCTSTERYECLRLGLELRWGFFLSFSLSDTPHYENVPFEVPESWVWTTIEEICSKIGSGSTPRGSNYSANGIPFFRSQNVYNDRLVYDDIKYISEEVHQKMKGTEVLANDLLLNITGGSLGRCAVVPADFNCGNVSQHVCIMRSILVEPEHFHALVLSSYFAKSMKITGSGREGLPKYSLEQMAFPLPPLSEQQRIVMEIEKLFALIDQIEQGKSDLQTTIKQTKSKILDLAIHGKLVPQDPNDEPAIELLKRINPDFTPCDNGHYTQLPNGWAACRLEQVAGILDNLRKPINSSERDSRIRNRQIDELYPYYGATGQVGLIDDYIINGNYLLLGEDGAPFLDKNAIKAYSINGKSWVNNHAHILSPKIDFEFLQYSLNQIDYSEYVNGSTRLKLTQTDMRSIKIMLPPLAEQKRIKSKIQTLFSQLDLMMESL